MNRSNHKNKWTDKDVEVHWDKVASIYIKENNKLKDVHNQRFKETVKYLKPSVDLNVLNITSRDCEADEYIKKAMPDAEVINAEISSGLMKEAKKVRPWVKQIKIDTYSKLQFSDNTFDRIVSLETLEHVEDPIGFLSELHSRLVLSCPPLTSEPAYRIYTFLFGGHGEGPHRFIRSSEVKSMLLKTGWELLFHKGTILVPIGPKQIQDLGEKLINCFQTTWISEFGIRQFYICEKY